MSTTPQTVKVTVLTDNHTHARQPVAKGAVIDVSPAAAAWLATHKIATTTSTSTKQEH